MFDGFTPLSINEFTNKLAANGPRNMTRYPLFGVFFVLFLIVSLTPSFNKPDFSRYLIIFMITLIPAFEITNVVMPDQKAFFSIAASTADAAAVNPNGIKTLLANGLSTFLIKDKPVFSNSPKSLLKNT